MPLSTGSRASRAAVPTRSQAPAGDVLRYRLNPTAWQTALNSAVTALFGAATVTVAIEAVVSPEGGAAEAVIA